MSHNFIRGCVCLLVRRSIGPLVGPSVGLSVGNAFVSAGRDKLANGLFRVYKLVRVTERPNQFDIADPSDVNEL